MTDRDKELNRKIDERAEKIDSLIKKDQAANLARVFANGLVGEMPVEEGTEDLSGGFFQKHLYTHERFDVWLRYTSPGASLPYHKHPDNHLSMFLVDGTVHVDVKKSGDKRPNRRTLSMGQPNAFVPMQTRFRLNAPEDSLLLCIYRPPIGRQE